MPDVANQLTVTTRRYIDKNPELRDLVFNHDPTMSMIGDTCHEEVGGGLNWNDNIEYDVQDGGPYAKGQDLPSDQRQIEQALQFFPKYNVVMIPFYMEDINVFNVQGDPMTIISLVKERVDAAFVQMGAQAALQRYMQGQTGNFTKFPNGLLEASSDGVNIGWDGNTYPVYGTLTRSLYGGRMLSPKPYNFAGGAITLPIMESIYQSVNFGSGKYECNVITTTPAGYGFIRNNYQTQQRFQNVTVGKAGFRGLEYNGATIFASRYAPGSYLMNPANGVASTNPTTVPNTNGTNDRVAVRMFAYAQGPQPGGAPAQSPLVSTPSAYPSPSTMWGNGSGSAGVGGNVFGETIFFENIRKPMVKYRTAKRKPFNGSLDEAGFIPSAGNTKLVGKVLLAHNWSILPGYVAYGFNFQG
jgi:hypothetical protein